jgi:CheY-like chemotaxis protein
MGPSFKRILVIEDSQEVREVLSTLLESEGYSVTSCGDAQHGFELVKGQRPDLVLTDLMLGPSSGLDLITRMRSDLAPPVPPIVVCSGFNGLATESLKRGAAAFIPKPFDAQTLLKIIGKTLDHQTIEANEHQKAASHSLLLRAKVVQQAKEAMKRIEPHRKEMFARAQWTTEFLPSYYGFGQAFVALLDNNLLQVAASSDEGRWPPGRALDLGLCRDILETDSSILLPDLLSLGIQLGTSAYRALRFFAGVPLLNGATAVGALCFVDDSARHMDPEGYLVLESLGRRASSILSASKKDAPPIWTAAGFLTRDALCMLLGTELSRLEREDLSLDLLIFSGRARRTYQAARSAIADLGSGRFAALFARADASDAHRTLLGYIEEATHSGDFNGGGAVSIEGGSATSFHANEILRLAERLFEGAQRGRAEMIERIVIRREPLAVG